MIHVMHMGCSLILQLCSNGVFLVLSFDFGKSVDFIS